MKAINCRVRQVGNHTGDWEKLVKVRREQAVARGKERSIPLAEALYKIDKRR